MAKDDVPLPLPWEQPKKPLLEHLYDEASPPPTVPDAAGEMPVVDEPKRVPDPYLRRS